MGTTNNGWSKDPPVTRIFVGGDESGAEVATGDVVVVFTGFLERFHAEVESIREVHGFRTSAFNASLLGSVPTSNHVSGTAVDVNGATHPNEGAHNGAKLSSGFSDQQTAALRALLADFPVVRWGGDFRVGARDYMHFEIAANGDRVREFVEGGVRGIAARHAPGRAQEVPLMRLILIREDGRIFLVGPTLFEQVPDVPRADALKAIYGKWVDVSIHDAEEIHRQVNHNIEATAANLRRQWELVGGLSL